MTVLKVGQAIKDFIEGINANFNELNNRKTYKTLYNGSVNIPALNDGTSTTITLNDDITKYDGLILQLGDCNAYQHFDTLTVGKVFKPVHDQFDLTESMMGWNMFGYNCEILNKTKLKLSGFIYSGSAFEKNQYLDIYELRYLNTYSVYPLTKVIGIKFN